MKKTLKVAGIVLGSILLLILIVNIGFTLWLKYQLPDYIKNKTPYEITYKNLNVEILSGSISADGILIKSKNPTDKNVLAIDGFVDGLSVSRLGIIDLIKNNQINTNSVTLSNPRLRIALASPKTVDSVKKKMPFLIRNINITKGNIEIIQTGHSKVFSAQNLNLEVKNLSLNDDPDELPFALDSYKIKAKNFFFRLDHVYSISASDIKTDNGKLEIADFEMKSLVDFANWQQSFRSQKSLFGIKSKKLAFDELVFSKTKLSLKNAQIQNPEFVIQNRDDKVVKTAKKKSKFELNFENVDIINGKLSILNSNGDPKLSIADFDANIEKFLMDEETSKNKLPFSYQNYKLSGKKLFYDAGKYYTMALSSFDADSQGVDLKSFKLNPKVSRAEFVRMIPMENDLFNIAVARIQLSGLKWKFEKDQPDIYLKNAKLHQVDATIFRSKIPKDNPKEKLLYSKLLRQIKFPLLVDNLNLISSKLVYEEDKPDANGPGKVFFSNFNLNLKNLNSNQRKGANTKVPIAIHCKFMGVSTMKVNWNFDTADLRDNFTIGGYINNLPADDINPFIKPYMNVTATGTITSLNYNFKGNNDIMNGTFKITHKDLKVAVLDKNTKEKKKFLSAVANLVVKKDSRKFPESVDIYVERNKERSFFNFYWKGIEDGLKKSLLVIKI